MTSDAEVQNSLESFAESCNAHDRLKIMNRDWNRTIHVQTTDTGQDFTLVAREGEVSVKQGKPDRADMVVQSTAEILEQVFYGEVSPNEPYNAGTLRVQGTEKDVLHLDFITAMLWE